MKTQKKIKREVFRQMILNMVASDTESIDAEALYKSCKQETDKQDIKLKWLEFCEILYSSGCFINDNGTHGTVYIPKEFRLWNDKFMKGL